MVGELVRVLPERMLTKDRRRTPPSMCRSGEGLPPLIDCFGPGYKWCRQSSLSAPLVSVSGNLHSAHVALDAVGRDERRRRISSRTALPVGIDVRRGHR